VTPASASKFMPSAMAPSDPDYTRELYSVEQAAVYVGVGTWKVYAAVASGELAHRRLGRIRFSQADLDAWRAANRVEAKSFARLLQISSASVDRREQLQPIPRPVVRRFSK